MTKTFFLYVFIVYDGFYFSFFAINRCFIAMNLWLLGHLMHQARNVDLEAWLALSAVINYDLSIGTEDHQDSEN